MSHWRKTKSVFKIGPVQQSLHVCLRFDFGPFASSTLCVLSLATCTSAGVEKGPVKVAGIAFCGKTKLEQEIPKLEFTCPIIIGKFHSKKNVTKVMTLLQ